MNDRPAPLDVADRAGSKEGDRPRLLSTLARRILVVCAFIFLVGFTLVAGVRFGARTTAGRAIVVRLVDGLALGTVGHLRIAGLNGDLLGAFSVKQLRIVDTKGVWLQIDDLGVVWDPLELLGRRVHINRLVARVIRIDRQPVLAAQPPSAPSKPPVSVMVDDLRARLETAPAFSVQLGVWTVTSRFLTRLNGGVRANLSAQSLLHRGDGITLVLRVGRGDHFLLRADAVEGKGGGTCRRARAGSGLSAANPGGWRRHRRHRVRSHLGDIRSRNASDREHSVGQGRSCRRGTFGIDRVTAHEGSG